MNKMLSNQVQQLETDNINLLKENKTLRLKNAKLSSMEKQCIIYRDNAIANFNRVKELEAELKKSCDLSYLQVMEKCAVYQGVRG